MRLAFFHAYFKYRTHGHCCDHGVPQPALICVRSDVHGLSHGLKHVPACFPNALFSPRHIKKVQHQKVLDFFGRGTRT